MNKSGERDKREMEYCSGEMQREDDEKMRYQNELTNST